MTRTLEQQREYYARNREHIIARTKRYYYSHREARLKQIADYNRQHKDLRRRWQLQQLLRMRTRLVLLLGGICYHCSSTERLEIDHKLAGGTKDRIAHHNPWQMYRYYLKHPEEAREKLQILCKKHNLEKQFNNHEH